MDGNAARRDPLAISTRYHIPTIISGGRYLCSIALHIVFVELGCDPALPSWVEKKERKRYSKMLILLNWPKILFVALCSLESWFVCIPTLYFLRVFLGRRGSERKMNLSLCVS